MNFFTSLAQLRHGFGGGAKSEDTSIDREASVDTATPAFKQAFNDDPPAPMLDDDAIIARAALAAEAVAQAAEIEYAKHTGEDDFADESHDEEIDAFEAGTDDAIFDADGEQASAEDDGEQFEPAPTHLAFGTDDEAPVQVIEGFEPDLEALEIEIQRAPGDDRPLEGTDIARFLNEDGTYGADIVLRFGASETAPAVRSALRLCGSDDIDLDKVSITLLDAAA